MCSFIWSSSLRMSCRDEGIVFLEDLWLMLVIELVSKWEICWAFVEPSFF